MEFDMTCEACNERRKQMLDALLEGKIAAAVGHAVKGAAEMVGLNGKEEPKPARRPRKAK
jgi:predicted methyltransferase MtxX (methanogen marker protein 4)